MFTGDKHILFTTLLTGCGRKCAYVEQQVSLSFTPIRWRPPDGVCRATPSGVQRICDSS